MYSAIILTLKEIERSSIIKEDQKEAQQMREKFSEFYTVFILHWLSDFLAPICLLNKQLQAQSYQLGSLKEQISLTIQQLRDNYLFKKPNLFSPDNLDQTFTLQEMMEHHLNFGGFYLTTFMENCKFVSETKVVFCYQEDKEIDII